MCRLSWNLGTSTSWNPQGLSSPVMGLLYIFTVGSHNVCTKVGWKILYSGKQKLKQKEIFKWNKKTNVTLTFIYNSVWSISHIISSNFNYMTYRCHRYGKKCGTYSVTYHARLEGHPNDLATSLLPQPPQNRRLKRYYPANLVTRF